MFTHSKIHAINHSTVDLIAGFSYPFVGEFVVNGGVSAHVLESQNVVSDTLTSNAIISNNLISNNASVVEIHTDNIQTQLIPLTIDSLSTLLSSNNVNISALQCDSASIVSTRGNVMVANTYFVPRIVCSTITGNILYDNIHTIVDNMVISRDVTNITSYVFNKVLNNSPLPEINLSIYLERFADNTHTHHLTSILNYQSLIDTTTRFLKVYTDRLPNFADVGHTHTISQIDTSYTRVTYLSLLSAIFQKANTLHQHKLNDVLHIQNFTNLLTATTAYIERFSDASHVMSLNNIIYDRQVLSGMQDYRISSIVDFFTQILKNHTITVDRIIGAKNTFNVQVSALSCYLDVLSASKKIIDDAPSSNHTHTSAALIEDTGKLNEVLQLASAVGAKFNNLKTRITHFSNVLNTIYGECIYSFEMGKQMLRDYSQDLQLNTVTFRENSNNTHVIKNIAADTLSAHTIESVVVLTNDIDTDILQVNTINSANNYVKNTYVGSLSSPYIYSTISNVYNAARFTDLYASFMTTDQITMPMLNTYFSKVNNQLTYE